MDKTTQDLLRPLFESQNETAFFEALVASNKIVLDWSADEIWTAKDSVHMKPDTALQMHGSDFHGLLARANAGFTSGGTSACFLVDLLALGIDVDVAKSSLFALPKIKEFKKVAQEVSKTGTIGKLTQFIPTYQ